MSATPPTRRTLAGTTESPWIRRLLIGLALLFIALFLVLPLAAVFTEALRKGADAFFAALVPINLAQLALVRRGSK